MRLPSRMVTETSSDIINKNAHSVNLIIINRHACFQLRCLCAHLDVSVGLFGELKRASVITDLNKKIWPSPKKAVGRVTQNKVFFGLAYLNI